MKFNGVLCRIVYVIPKKSDLLILCFLRVPSQSESTDILSEIKKCDCLRIRILYYKEAFCNNFKNLLGETRTLVDDLVNFY